MPFDPATSFSRHPFFRDHALIFESDPMRRGYAQLRLPMMLGLGGAFSARPPGTGKTTLMHYCGWAFRAQYPGLPVIEVAAHRLAPTATRSLPYRLCLAAGDLKPPRTGQELRARLEAVFLNMARSSEFKRVLLMIDEGQDLGANGFFIIKDLFNQLTREGLALSVFVCGVAGKLYGLLQDLESNDESGLIRRFASFEVTRTGYESVEDVASVCEAIDSTRWSELDDKTVVESIWPLASRGGFRLANYAAWIYDAYNRNEVLAGEIFNVLRWLFISHPDRKDLKLNATDISSAVDATRGGGPPPTRKQ